MPRATTWIRNVVFRTTPDFTYSALVDFRPTGWTLVTARWQVNWTQIESANASVYPMPALMMGLYLSEGNPPLNPGPPTIAGGPGISILWQEAMRWDRFDTIHGSSLFAINSAPPGDQQRQTKAQRRIKDVQGNVYLNAGYSEPATPGIPFTATGQVELLWMEP